MMSNVRWVVSFWIVLFAIAANGQQNSVSVLSGTIADEAESVPIPYAHVWIHEDTGKISSEAKVDARGMFEAKLKEGYYNVLVAAPGFAPYCKRIWLHDGGHLKVTIQLQPDEENLQQSTP